jgi:hypothetical protein
MGGGRSQDGFLILDRPYLVYSGTMVNAAATLARIDRELAAVLRPGDDGRKHSPGIIGRARRSASALSPNLNSIFLMWVT